MLRYSGGNIRKSLGHLNTQFVFVYLFWGCDNYVSSVHRSHLAKLISIGQLGVIGMDRVSKQCPRRSTSGAQSSRPARSPACVPNIAKVQFAWNWLACVETRKALLGSLELSRNCVHVPSALFTIPWIE